MRYGFLMIEMLMLGALAQGAMAACTPTGSNICVSSQYTSYPTGSTITLTATTATSFNEVTFLLNNGTETTPLATVQANSSTPDTYTYVWQDVPTGNYNITAVAGDGSASSSATTLNGVIDKVGDPEFAYNPPLYNPAIDPAFSETGAAGSTWVEGDNQMCLANWMYNGATMSFPDGTCEWTDSANTPAYPATPAQNISTVSSLDDVMHTLSDFDKWAQSLLAQSIPTISTSFDAWYPQAAGWIAPPCGAAADLSACYSSGTGRLLSIYEPSGYPGIPGYGDDYSGPTVDVLQDWNTIITNWLNTSFTPSGSVSKLSSPTSAQTAVWCLPSESDPTLSAATTELTYINQNSYSPNWGDLPHVLACLNYNAGPTPTQANSYSACLSALTYNNSCVTALPPQCSPSLLGPSTIPPPAFSATNDPNNNRCNVNVAGSYANWVSSQFQYGAIYNYQNCLNALTGACPASLPAACSSSVLGRTLLNTTLTPEPAFSGTNRCNTVATGSFANWVQQNVSMFTDEGPKFALRYAFLDDIYTRAVTLQRITSQARQAMQNFFKTCNGCADGSACNDNKCDDGSACGQSECANGASCSSNSDCNGGQCNQCIDGGPAAQLVYARLKGESGASQVALLPNSVIYGWRDNPPVGQAACIDSQGNKVGCDHLVRVTAFGAGRTGGYSQANGDTLEDTLPFQTLLPWIRTYDSNLDFTRNYELDQRDGYVYVGIQRWDQSHNTPITYPNKHNLWQFMFGNPNPTYATLNQTADPIESCTTTAYSNYGLVLPSGQGLGFGLETQTAQGLAFYQGNQQLLSSDVGDSNAALSNAFMISDSGNGMVDPIAAKNDGACLNAVRPLLNAGIQSHACARYVASIYCPPVSSGSTKANPDYCMQFVDCNSAGVGTPTSNGP